MKKKVELKDIEEWATSKETIDKYKERYGEDWQSKIEESYDKMFNKVIDSNENMLVAHSSISFNSTFFFISLSFSALILIKLSLGLLGL